MISTRQKGYNITWSYSVSEDVCWFMTSTLCHICLQLCLRPCQHCSLHRRLSSRRLVLAILLDLSNPHCYPTLHQHPRPAEPSSLQLVSSCELISLVAWPRPQLGHCRNRWYMWSLLSGRSDCFGLQILEHWLGSLYPTWQFRVLIVLVL